MKIQKYDAVVVGAGFAGLYMLHRLRELGLTARLFEAGKGVGGTWFWNRYPGARCDIESLQYSYSFSEDLQREWKWTERYATQPEILRYLNHVADRFGLRGDIQLETRVTSAAFDDDAGRWTVKTDRGDEVSSEYCVMATGCLSIPKPPEYKGLNLFRGRWLQTALWPDKPVDFSGKRVAVIGTGSSGTQCIPLIAQEAEHLYVFQRTPNFSMPARNRPMTEDFRESWDAKRGENREKARTSLFGILIEQGPQSALAVSREDREAEYERRWQDGGLSIYGAFGDLFVSKEANDTAADFVRAKVKEIVRDPAVAQKLMPTQNPLGTKRLCVGTDYYETFNRANVTLVDVRATPVEQITAGGLRTSNAEYAVDIIVFATGFDAMTGALCDIDIRGREGTPLKEKWSAGPRTYLGLAVAGFPNLFMITGPGSPSVFSNMVVSIEQHVDWIAACVRYAREHELAPVEASAEAEDAWMDHVNTLASYTLFPQANSWYVGANVPGKTRIFMPYIGGVGAYRQKCEEVAAKGYEGFTFSHAMHA